MAKAAIARGKGRDAFQPIHLGPFTLTETGVLVQGRPSFGQYADALSIARKIEKASPWWVAGLLAYGEKRKDWEKQLDQIVDATGYSMGRIRNMKSTAENVAPSRRRADVDYSVHEAVASLNPKEQVELLELAATEGLSSREVKLIVIGRRRTKVIQGQAVLEGKFRVVAADPAWPYRDRQPSGSSAEAHYETMTMEQIIELPVREHTYRDAVLFLWVPETHIYSNPGPRDAIENWGFEHKTGFVWDKVEHNRGHYISVRHEHLFICTRGSYLPEQLVPMIDSVQTIRRSAEHSEKPAEFYNIIKRLYPTGPHLEMFAREPREGWTVFGNDARLWAQDAERSA